MVIIYVFVILLILLTLLSTFGGSIRSKETFIDSTEPFSVSMPDDKEDKPDKPQIVTVPQIQYVPQIVQVPQQVSPQTGQVMVSPQVPQVPQVVTQPGQVMVSPQIPQIPQVVTQPGQVMSPQMMTTSQMQTIPQIPVIQQVVSQPNFSLTPAPETFTETFVNEIELPVFPKILPPPAPMSYSNINNYESSDYVNGLNMLNRLNIQTQQQPIYPSKYGSQIKFESFMNSTIEPYDQTQKHASV